MNKYSTTLPTNWLLCLAALFTCAFKPPHKNTQADLKPTTHHYLNLALAHLQIMLIVDIHPLQGTAHPLICSHEEHDCKATCRIEKETKLSCISPQRGDRPKSWKWTNVQKVGCALQITTIFIIIRFYLPKIIMYKKTLVKFKCHIIIKMILMPIFWDI